MTYSVANVSKVIDKLKRSVSHIPIVKITNPMNGEETLTEGSTATVSVVFFKKETGFNQDFEGMFERGDGFLVYSSTIAISRDDKITVDTNNYRVHDVLDYYGGDANSTKIFSYANLFKLD